MSPLGVAARVEIKGVPAGQSMPDNWSTAKPCDRSSYSNCATSCIVAVSKQPSDIVMEHVDITTLVADFQLDSLQRDNWQRFVEAEEDATGYGAGRRPFQRASHPPAAPCRHDRTTLSTRQDFRARAGRARAESSPPSISHRSLSTLTTGLTTPELASKSWRRSARLPPAPPKTRWWWCGASKADTMTAAKEIQLRLRGGHRGHPSRDAPGARPMAAPTSSASSPAPTACIRTPTAPAQLVTRERVTRS